MTIEQSTTNHDAIRNRIKCHRKVRAGELVPHEWNFRVHPEAQKAALAGIYREVGFARSLLAFELPNGRLKLIDGHLRRDLDPDMEVDVEILDVTEEEARALLLSIDSLAALAQTQEELHQRLLEITPTKRRRPRSRLASPGGETARRRSAPRHPELPRAVPDPGDVPRREAAGRAARTLQGGWPRVQGTAGVMVR